MRRRRLLARLVCRFAALWLPAQVVPDACRRHWLPVMDVAGHCRSLSPGGTALPPSRTPRTPKCRKPRLGPVDTLQYSDRAAYYFRPI
eukprot:481856-Pleurochrysis_carterae.AAC.1